MGIALPCVRIEPGLAGLTAAQVAAAEGQAARLGITLREAVLRMGLVSEAALLRAAAQKGSIEVLNFIDTQQIPPEALRAVSAQVASHYGIVPLRLDGRTLTVATADPFDGTVRRELLLVLDGLEEVVLALAPTEAVQAAMRRAYGVGAATVERMVHDEGVDTAVAARKDLMAESEAREASVMKLVNQLLVDAIKDGATDIHFEPYESTLKIRYRIDGVLLDAGTPSTVRFFKDGIASRIKVMAGLDIAEKRLPQDGRAQVDLLNNRYDLRVSVLPTRHGEAVNIRILPSGSLICDLAGLGMPEDVVRHIKGLIARPHGIILVTGPTGSGKTTTLYTCMNLLRNTDRKILTIEDPVEYDMPGIVQMQVHAEIGFTFARALRSMLRHDPDIMLVGEIRDLETAETAIRTALTGHLVFSTLHTNDAASAIVRLLDMGIEPYLVASSVEAILAQRLVRVICPLCREPHDPEPEVATAIRSLGRFDQAPTGYRGKGCAECRFTGFHGRTVITELLLMSDAIRTQTVTREPATRVHAQACREGMKPLLTSGIEKALKGETTFEEVLRATKGMILE